MAHSGSQVAPRTTTAEQLNDRELFFRCDPHKAEWVDVQPGVTADRKAKVFGPLQAGDLVVRNATDSIRSGATVSVANK
jgi:hypothetical protein